MLNAHEFNLFITPGTLAPRLDMAQYDSGRQWTAHLKDQNGEDFSPPSGATATITGTNKRGVPWILDADISGSSVTFTPEGAATDQYGAMFTTLTIENDGEQITALGMVFDIQKKGVTNEEAATSPEFETAMQAAAAEAVEDAMTEAGILLAANQDAKSNAMTQPVGVDGNGKLWVQPVGSEGAVTPEALLAAAGQLTTAQEATFRADIGAGTYSKPTAGIPKNDLASAVRTTLDKADTAYQKPSGGIPASDMAQAVQTALTAAGTAVQPSALAAYITKEAQTAKANNQTQAVGIDANGKLWVQPPGSGGGGASIVYVDITAQGSGYVSNMTFDQISAADAAGNILVPRYNYFEGRLIKLNDNLAAFSIVDLTVPQVPILRTFTVDENGTEGTYIDIGGAAYVYLTKNGDDYDIDTTNTPEILRTRGNVLNYFYDGIAVKLMVNGYAHPLVYHYGDGILKFGGPEYTTVNGHHVQQDVVYTWSASAHVARDVVTPLNADLLTEKTAAMTQAVGYRASDGTLWTAPGGGGGGSGAELFEVYITESGGVLSASETVADIMAAYQAGKIVRYYNEVGAEGLLFATPTSSGISIVCFDDSDGGHPTMMTIYSIADDGTVAASSEDILNGLLMPSTQTRTASQMASGLLAQSNVIYTITSSATGFVLTNSTNPISKAGQCIEIRLTTGSTAITTPTWPSWCKLMNGWDGKFAANTYYDIVIDDAGNVYAGSREVS